MAASRDIIFLKRRLFAQGKKIQELFKKENIIIIYYLLTFTVNNIEIIIT